MIFEARQRRFLAEINVIPLVDVVLVLLVIFMVTAPMLYRGMDIKLPTFRVEHDQARRSERADDRKDQTLYLDEGLGCSVGSTGAEIKAA